MDKTDKKKTPVKEAVALEYNSQYSAPIIIATGRGHVAERIISRAEELKIPIHRDPEVVSALNMLKIGDEIPQELYTVVAQILIYVSDMDKKHGG